MSLIAIEASIRLKDPSTREAALNESARLQLATRTDEAGCLVYCFAADPCEPGHIQVYELWENEESLAAHFFHPNYLEMRDLLGRYGLASAVSRKLRIDKTAPVYGTDFKPSASFD
jgi:quinol monooxygenase YgiN